MNIYNPDAKVYRVVAVKQPRHHVGTTLRKLHEAAAKAGIHLADYYPTRAAAEEVLAAIEDHADADLVTKIEYGALGRIF